MTDTSPQTKYIIVIRCLNGNWGCLHLHKSNVSDYQYHIREETHGAAVWDTWKQAAIFNRAFLQDKGEIREILVLITLSA